MILAGDVGGTNTRLAFFEKRGEKLHNAFEHIYPSHAYASLEDIVAEFLDSRKFPLESVAIGVAGPVRDGVCRATNLPWVVDSRLVAKRIGVPSITLLNDLEANAYGIATLAEDDFAVLQRGVAHAKGNCAVISPGTGLGEAALHWDGARYLPLASEGGHSSFAPRDELQDELLKYYRAQFGHVSWERFVCGPGLVSIYEFLRDTGRGEEPSWLAAKIKNGDPAPVISEAALAGKSALCEKALDLFVVLLGSEAGNVALKMLALGGVYIGGGIAPKILPKLQTPAFLVAFADKGRMKEMLASMPVRVILNDGTALRGAALRAMMLQAGNQPLSSAAPAPRAP
ncbi:MAG TPA: glucokinase [Candidatus Acidoferrales bacterium]|nr:glucokinase [Candidatus Acidoferrales bacterium]